MKSRNTIQIDKLLVISGYSLIILSVLSIISKILVKL